MSAKNLLNENTIRRFMKLANVDSLTNNFIAESYAIEEEDENTDTDGGPISEVEEEEEDLELLQGEEESFDAQPDDEIEDEPIEDEPMDDVLGEADISLTEEEAQLLIDLGDRLRDALGAEGDEDMDLDMDEPAMDEPEIDEMPPEEEEEVLQEALVAEVLKRVTRRIIREKKENK